MPYYPLYALLFVETGLSDGEISGLFALWSVTGFVAGVPTGALADRWSRRGCLVLAGVLQAGAFALWTAFPVPASFAAGLVVWGVAGALMSGAAEALVYDGLAAVGAAGSYLRVRGRMSAAELLVQLPTALAATVLFALGGYPLVGWASVAFCLAAATVALRFPEAPRAAAGEDAGSLRSALADVLRRPGLRLSALAVALIGGLDAVEEYFPVVAADRGVPVATVPLAVLGISLAGAAGAALAERAGRLPGRALPAMLALSAAALGTAVVLPAPAALAGVAVFYALYLAVLVVAEARLQDRIGSARRATVTSVAALGIELSSLVVFGTWALGGLGAIAVLVLVVVPVTARALSHWGAVLSPTESRGRESRGSSSCTSGPMASA
ncbi:MAG TPA: MFS transporter [Blastococcus sp.]|nr:MFS transporter [Blastococcus sp.]